MKQPQISETAFIAEGTIVRGDVSISADCSIWFHTTVRAEHAPILIGSCTNIQDNAVLHVDPGYPILLGEFVTVGHGAVIHGCSIDDNSLIGMGATVLNGAKIGKNCIIGANALIPQNMIVPDHSLVLGLPGKIIRSTTQEEAAANKENALLYVKEKELYR